MARKPPRWLPHPLWLIVSLAIMLVVIVPMAYVMLPDVHRWHTLNQLTDDDLNARERALNYVIRRASSDPAVRRGAIERLDGVKERANFVQMVNALDRAGVWSRQHVPADAWLRWLGMLVKADETEVRRIAAEELAKLTHRADDTQVHDLLRPLLNDINPDVRDATLRTTALLAGTNEDAISLRRMISQRTSDDAAPVARRAWMLLGLLDFVSSYQINWRDAPPTVAEALLWAAVHSNPDNPQPALDALQDKAINSELRVSATYALHHSKLPQVHAALLRILEHRPLLDPNNNAERFAITGAALLALPVAEQRDRVASVTKQYAEDLVSLYSDPEVAFPSSSLQRLAAAVMYRWHRGYDRLNDLLTPEVLQRHPALALAMIEGMPVGEHALPVRRTHPAMIRLVAFTRHAEPDISLIADLFMHEQATMRDLACVAAADRLNDEALNALIEMLILDLNDDAKMSGAILSGLTGLQTDLLRERVEREDIWAVRKIMQVGLWMQGGKPAMNEQVPGLLTRRDLPMSTILLALIHRQHPAGLDYLLAPHGKPPPDLQRMLVHYRWWHVLDHYLPEDAPSLWLWGDEALQRFQLDVLRNWYLLHRGELTRRVKQG